METRIFERIYEEALVKKPGVREITYDQFIEIRKSGEEFILVDVLPQESYESGHIEGAISFPLETIDAFSVLERLRTEIPVIVYCGSFECNGSTIATQKLSELGFKVLDFKGGIREWQEKGNALMALHKI